MSRPPPMFDLRLRRLRMERARRIALADADFLLQRAAEDICDRLAVTNREFCKAVDVLTPAPGLRERIARQVRGIEIHAVERIGDDGNLGLGEQQYDLAFSAFGLHWANDLPGALAQIRRALKPDGLFMAVLPAEGTLRQLREALLAAETALCGGAGLRVEPFADVRELGALLQRAGFALPVADVEKAVIRYDSVKALVRDLRAMGATTALRDRPGRLPRGIWERVEREYSLRFADPDGRLPASFDLVHLTGWAPHESQQKPLAPGSGKTSLAQVLKR